MKIKKVAVIGVGLLGGSTALAIKSRWPAARIIGVGRRMESLKAALRAAAADEVSLDTAGAVRQADLVILATPVGAFERHLRAMKGGLKPGAMVTDVGSAKASAVRLGERILGHGGPFIGSHPMAGSEQSGVAHAKADLLDGATCVITPTPDTPPGLVRRAMSLWRELGMKTAIMSPAVHDRTMAFISHLPHILSALLMRLPRESDLKTAAGGFRDCTRLSAGPEEMWRDILLANRSAVLAAIDAFDESLIRLRDLIELSDADGIRRLLLAARKRREKLEKQTGRKKVSARRQGA